MVTARRIGVAIRAGVPTLVGTGGSSPLAGATHRRQRSHSEGAGALTGASPCRPVPHQPDEGWPLCPAAAAHDAGTSALISSARTATQAIPMRRPLPVRLAVMRIGSLRHQVLNLLDQMAQVERLCQHFRTIRGKPVIL